MWILALVLLVWPVAAAQAERPDLALPLDCEPGVDCWILRYVDHDPGPGVRDYACGKLAGDGHKGTDFAIRDLAAMVAGVEVRAAAAGIVDALRDGMPDQSLDEGGLEALGGKSCGNGIRLDHGDGWSTWYCHLRRGSLMVQEGDAVEAGQALALVGLSGETSFPHLHFDLRHGDRAVDPFVGTGAARLRPGRAAAVAADVMAKLAYRPVVLDQCRHRAHPAGGSRMPGGAITIAGRSPSPAGCSSSGSRATGSRPATGCSSRSRAPTARRSWRTRSSWIGAGPTGFSSSAPGARAMPGPPAPISARSRCCATALRRSRLERSVELR